MKKRIRLKELVQVSCGDKGNDSDINIFAPNQEVYEVLKFEITEERIKQFYGDLVKGSVTRYEVPNLFALKFLMKDALGGGGPSSLRIDNLGKTLGAAVLRMEIEIDDKVPLTKV